MPGACLYQNIQFLLEILVKLDTLCFVWKFYNPENRGLFSHIQSLNILLQGVQNAWERQMVGAYPRALALEDCWR